MPAKSKKQYKKMFVLYKQGEITKAELDEFTKSVKYKKLPLRKRATRPQPRRGK
jgi:hypothetical protein